MSEARFKISKFGVLELAPPGEVANIDGCWISSASANYREGNVSGYLEYFHPTKIEAVELWPVGGKYSFKPAQETVLFTAEPSKSIYEAILECVNNSVFFGVKMEF